MFALGSELADAAILNGQRVLPAKAQSLGFKFAYPTIDAALRSIYRT
jgi:NAD dependent epimerase/dehydratase family enzyme